MRDEVLAFFLDADVSGAIYSYTSAYISRSQRLRPMPMHCQALKGVFHVMGQMSFKNITQ